MLCGVLPSSPLVWAGPSGAVTGETGGGVASPQKSSELNKPPSTQDFISFSVCLRAAPKEVLPPHTKKRRGSRYTKLLWQRANLPFQLLDLTIFYSFSSISLSSFLVIVQPVQTSLCSVLLLIYQPKWHCGLYFFLSVYVSVLGYCCCPAICLWVLL